MEAVCEATGAAESYSVSVSCVGSDCSLHVRDSVPAPQSQKNLHHKPHQSHYYYCFHVLFNRHNQAKVAYVS